MNQEVGSVNRRTMRPTRAQASVNQHTLLRVRHGAIADLRQLPSLTIALVGPGHVTVTTQGKHRSITSERGAIVRRWERLSQEKRAC